MFGYVPDGLLGLCLDPDCGKNGLLERFDLLIKETLCVKA